jgi:hypothetical protein
LRLLRMNLSSTGAVAFGATGPDEGLGTAFAAVGAVDAVGAVGAAFAAVGAAFAAVGAAFAAVGSNCIRMSRGSSSGVVPLSEAHVSSTVKRSSMPEPYNKI